ncbi:MAG TPA: MOSC domain-containing protein [Burkholderiales bacterium]|nr:MOSC domain-containing protein [Burkholderiales bacterium]
MHWAGELIHIHIAGEASAPMRALAEARLLAGVGIEDDRYATRRGTYSPRHHIDRQVTLIEAETLEALARDHGIVLAPHEHRRNLTTRGVPLNHLVGRYFSVGDCVLYGGRLNVPCRYLEDLLGKKVFKPLINRSGLNCRVLLGGTILPGDRIEPRAPQALDPALRAANEAVPLERPPEAW